MHARGEARIFHLGVLQRHTAGKRDSAITRRLPRSLVSSHAVASVALPLYSRPCVDTLNKFVWRRKVSKMRSRALLSVFFCLFSLRRRQCSSSEFCLRRGLPVRQTLSPSYGVRDKNFYSDVRCDAEREVTSRPLSAF